MTNIHEKAGNQASQPESNRIDICLFPIPDCVTFPGTRFPLHVFEPRYRNMIYQCLEQKTPVAICHTRKVISERKGEQSVQEALNSNQDTYQPFDVFSAGLCELRNITNDGRMFLDVNIDRRYRAVEATQRIPHMRYCCVPFDDRPETPEEIAANLALKDKIIHRLQALAYQYPNLEHSFVAEQWQLKDMDEFSFQLFGMVSFGSQNQQNILEMDSAHQRLTKALELLNQLA